MSRYQILTLFQRHKHILSNTESHDRSITEMEGTSRDSLVQKTLLKAESTTVG